MKSTIALFSSARRDGNTGQLMDQVATALNIEVVDLGRKKLAPYTYEHGNRDDDFEPLMQRVLTAEQIIFASPIYWYSVSPPMKVFLDRISDYLDMPELLDQGRKLRGKTGFVLCTSVLEVADLAFIDAFTRIFDYLGVLYGGCLHANCVNGHAAEKFNREVELFVERLRG